MRLVRAVVASMGPFDRVSVPFADEHGQPRSLTVVHGGSGTGKTSLFQAIATTRPGHAVAQMARHHAPSAVVPSAACEWLLGMDDPARPHPLYVASPNVRWLPEEEAEGLRRREQGYYDRVAQEGGFALLALSGARWFARQPLVLSAPARTVARYDVRAPLATDDAARAELSRETKQALAYAALSAALHTRGDNEEPRFDLLGQAMHEVVDRVAALAGLRYRGIEPHSFEPVFTEIGASLAGAPTWLFDTLPTRARHLVALAALSVRTLWAAYPERDPRESEGVILVDDVELHQDEHVLRELPGVLVEVLPRAQWILLTSSAVLAASVSVDDVVALRRAERNASVAVFFGAAALTH
ncbi:MAG TPA: hypothetical protein VFQ61_07895 [Polyangiaceae bacterium]|nr:hypothetical protein [Polyangiaceae bacterium]